MKASPSRPAIVAVLDDLARRAELKLGQGPAMQVREASTAAGDLLAAAGRVVTAFRALGVDRSVIPPPAMVAECEQAMVALEAAFAKAGGAA